MSFQPIILAELTRGRKLDQGNAQPGSLGADFGRLGIKLWDEVTAADPDNRARHSSLEVLNQWRNAIAHQDFDPRELGGTTTLRLAQVREWRAACNRLAESFDEVTRRYLQSMGGQSPW